MSHPRDYNCGCKACSPPATRYTVQVTLHVVAESEHEAYTWIRHALHHAKKAELVYVDSEVIETVQIDDDGNPWTAPNPREKGDDDGVEYADPSDELNDRD